MLLNSTVELQILLTSQSDDILVQTIDIIPVVTHFAVKNCDVHNRDVCLRFECICVIYGL